MGRWVGTVDGAGLAGFLLHDLDQPFEVLGFFGYESAGVDVDEVSPGCHLVGGDPPNGYTVAGFYGFLDGLAAGIDELADNDHGFSL